MKSTGVTARNYRTGYPLCFLFLLATICSSFSVSGALTTFGRSTARPARPSQDRKASGIRGRVMTEAFENAGTTPGLEIWRIENFEPVPYPKSDYGKFYSGDSYIILYTKEKNGRFSWDIHFWLGSQTTQDESGSAAIYSVHLDDQLGGGPTQHREVQGHESELFLSHFKSGIRYLAGGVSSGFTHVDPDAVEKRLFHVKGKRNIRVKQVDLTIASMNKGDCFILDAGRDVYVYTGATSKRAERLKAISAANQIRDQDHSGRARVHIIDEASSESEIRQFFDALGEGSASEIPEESVGGDDQEFESDEEDAVTLNKVSDASGTVQVTPIAQKPLRKNMLDTNDCYILETGSANIYVWTGKLCNKAERDAAMNKAQQFLTAKNYPSWTHVVRVIEGAEPTSFRQYFQTWQIQGELHTRLIRSAGAEPLTRLEVKSGGEAPEFMPDDGSGELEIFRVEDFELVPVDPDNYGKFFGGDSYVIKYHATNGSWIIYTWQGNQSTTDEKAASAIHAVNIDNELGGRATQIRVVQDHEPKHFLHIFKGKLIIFLGGHASGFKNIKEHDTYVPGETRLYRIRGTTPENVRASELVPKASSLEEDDVFIIENDNNTWIWFGKDSDQIERDLAQGFADLLAPDSTPVEIEQGSEPAEFWDALGGEDEPKKSFEDDLNLSSDPRLFHASVKANGKVKFEEIHDFQQEDLVEDDVMIVDSGAEVYLWIGKESTDDERKTVFKLITQKLLKKYNRANSVLISVRQGDEPESFTALFPSWDPDLWETASSNYADVKTRIQQWNESITED